MSADRWSGASRKISTEAAEWLVEFRTGDIDAAGRRDFDAWVRASPEHIRVFMEMAALWGRSGAIDPLRRIDVDAIITRAQSEQNVVALVPVGSRTEAKVGASRTAGKVVPGEEHGRLGQVEQRARRSPRGLKWAIAASMVSVALLAALIMGSGLFGPPTYSTAVDARRSIQLPDGSTVVLDSRSRLRVDFTASAREVELLQGQALFHVVKNPRRPFLVHAGAAVVRDVGTVFNVNRHEGGTTITVVEGRVAVTRPAAVPQRATGQALPSDKKVAQAGPEGRSAAQPVLLSGGEQIDMRVGRIPLRPARVNVNLATAWTHGEVVLESATLADVAQVFNRYSARTIVVKDLGSRPLHLSGIFATNPDFLIKYLRERPDIAVTETDSKIEITRDPKE